MTCRDCIKYGTTCCGALSLIPCRNIISKTGMQPDYFNEEPTNRDRLDTLTDEELVKFMIYDLPCIKVNMTNSEIGLLQWLQSPYNWEDFRVSRHKDYSAAIDQLEDTSNES